MAHTKTRYGGIMNELSNTVLTVYVPKPDGRLVAMIDAGSAIVGSPMGSPDPEAMVLIDYEGNRYHAENMQAYTDKLIHAAGRHLVRYPTVARRLAPAAELIEVGTYCYANGAHDFEVTNREALEAWTA